MTMTTEVVLEKSSMNDSSSCLKQLEHITRDPLCIGCGCPIIDPYVMKVHPDMNWHQQCLKCSECNRLLDEMCTCFVRGGKLYCKVDYQSLFTTQCYKCGISFHKNDLVMRAQNRIYHTECFSCSVCRRQLAAGEEFALTGEGLYCKQDNEILNQNPDEACVRNFHRNAFIKTENNVSHSGQNETPSNIGNSHSGKPKRNKDGKTTRVRTVLSEKQLQTLRTCYGANPRPDALMKEQLVEMTGLSPRVIRVWFQNKRCKDKKKTILLKHLQQQEKNLSGNIQGVPMVAQSPIRHDNGLQSIESYHARSWKHMHEYGMRHSDELNHNTFPSMMGSIYSSDDSVYLGEDDYTVQPGSVSSQFSGTSTSPHSSC